MFSFTSRTTLRGVSLNRVDVCRTVSVLRSFSDREEAGSSRTVRTIRRLRSLATAVPARRRAEAPCEYWKAQLSGAPNDLHLPTDYPRPALPSRRGKRRAIALSAQLLEAARTTRLLSGVTPFMSLLGAFNVFLFAALARKISASALRSRGVARPS